MIRTHLDLETYSEEDLKRSGLYKYAEHQSTDLNVVCWADGAGPVNIWMCWDKIPKAVFDAVKAGMDKDGSLLFGSTMPAVVREVLTGVIAAHNSQFERVVLNNWLARKSVPIKIKIENTICTMAKCAVHGIPQALEHAAKALGTFPKRVTGANEMRYFAKPRKDGTRATPQEEPKRFITLVLYCIDDVKAERDLDVNIPDLTERETKIYRLDQKINERGVRIDQGAIKNAIFLVGQYKNKLAEMCRTQTGYSPTQTGKLAEWIRAHGYPGLENLQAPTVVEALKSQLVLPSIKKVLKCYSVYGMKAVSKFDAMLRAVAKDGRLHGMFQYYGAGPGRWSSRIVQLHNMMRPLIPDVDAAIKAMRERSLNWIRWLWPDIDPMKVFASCVRGMLIAGEGKDLMSYDFAQIESRIQAWLAGAEWKLKIFREGKVKIYKATGAMMFGKTADEIVDTGEEQLYTASKIAELACGFQGGAAAIEKAARDMNITLAMDADDLKYRWRDANPEIVKLWYDLQDAAYWAVKNKGKAYSIPNKKIMFKVAGRWLYMKLPSGRRIAYLDPKVDSDNNITYMGTHTKTRQWVRVQTYGGKLLNNACEGIGRDLLVNGLLNMEEAGYETILTVHDEGVFEVDEEFGSDEEAMRLMTVPLQWAEGLPVKCAGWREKRYRK